MRTLLACRRQRSGSIPQARRGVSSSEELPEDLFLSPIIAPSPSGPARFYFAFGRPIPTTPDMARDKAACDAVYGEVRGEVERLLGLLLRKREADPYKDLLPRLAYENSWGGGPGRQAPTFKP